VIGRRGNAHRSRTAPTPLGGIDALAGNWTTGSEGHGCYQPEFAARMSLLDLYGCQAGGRRGRAGRASQG